MSTQENSVNDGGPAFPGGESYELVDLYGNKARYSKAPLKSGMTLRDYFAGQALAGWLASFTPDEPAKPKVCAALAYAMADAMIAAKGGEK